MISPNSIDQLLQVAVVEDVVGEYVNLKRAGSRYKGLCPFHDEKTPSFTVTPSLGIYKCFGCQKGGNAIQFLMEMESLSFTEAAKQLAKRYNIELVESGSGDAEALKEAQKHKENLHVVLDFARDFFKHQLFETEAGKNIALEYFRERGFTKETIEKWELGYSPEAWEALVSTAKKEQYNLENLAAAGLIKANEKGGYFDLYRNRVIFPIHGVSGRVIAFAGRKMSSTDPAPKYVNSPETELYKKSDVLYGIYQAKNSIKKWDKVYLTEGYTDVITLHQSGIENAVASSGTALTPGQIKLIRRFTPNVTVLYDGDQAGIKASLRGINLILGEDLNVRVVALPDGEDPDSYCAKLGPVAFKKYLEDHEESFIVFKAKLLVNGAGNDPIKRSEAVRDILSSLAEIKDPLKRNAFIKSLADICQMEEALLAQELSKILKTKVLQNEQEAYTELRQIIQSSGVDLPAAPLTNEHQERSLLRLLIKYGGEPFDESHTVFDVIKREMEEDHIIQFTDPLVKKVFDLVISEENHEYPGKEFFIHSLDPEISSYSAGIFSEYFEISPSYENNHIHVLHEDRNYRQELMSIFLHLRRKSLDALIRWHLEQMENVSDEEVDDHLQYLKYLNEVKLNIARILGAAVYHVN